MKCNLRNSRVVKMKELTLLLLYMVGCTSAYLIKVPSSNTPAQAKIAPLGWVHIQKLLLPLLDNVCEESTNVMIVQLAKDFTLDTANGDYMKTDVIQNLRNIKTGKGFLPKGEIFTEYNTDHVIELKALFEVFLYARDFDTFYKAAAWARQNVNCGLFVDAIYLAIINRRDTARVSIPAPYELLPNYFINREAVVRASLLLTADDISPTSEGDVRVEGNSYVLDTNYTADIDDGDQDAKLAYFREDIGLNSYYFLRKLRNSPWFNTPNDVKSLYGERMFMMMRQFAARYDLERYSHGLTELEGFNWESTIPYDPMLVYSNGYEFDHRTFANVLSDSDSVTFLKTIENNIANVVVHLRQAGHTKSQILSHLMEILVTSDKSYETMCRKLLGYDKDTTERHYSVLEHYMTTLRDPMFWRINKKMVQLINNALKVVPGYTRNELYFPGVEIVNVETKKMMTSFDNFQFDVTDSLKTSTANTTFQVKISQTRLNHKPFIMKLNISSLVYKKGFVKIYIGPKMMPGELAIKKHLFVLLDSFEVSLKRGFNVISRSSEEMVNFSNDFISLRALRKKVEDAEFGLNALPLKTVESQTGYPSRLVLPRGLANGLPLQVFVFIAPLTKGAIGGASPLANMELNTAILSPGYPLDLPIEIKQLFGLPNSLVREFTVMHKSEVIKPENGGRPGGPGKGRPGTGGRPMSNNYDFDNSYDHYQTDFTANRDEFNENTQDTVAVDSYYDDSLLVHGLLGDRPDFTYRKTDTTNYGGNKNQYRKKEDYASKRTDKSNYMSKTDYSTSTKNEFDIVIPEFDRVNPVTTPKYINLDTVPVHGLLGVRPDFTYKNKDTTDYTEKKTQYRKKEDYVSKRKDKSYDITQPDNNIKQKFDSIVEDDTMYDDLLVTYPPFHINRWPIYGLLGDKPDFAEKSKDTTDYMEYKNKGDLSFRNDITKEIPEIDVQHTFDNVSEDDSTYYDDLLFTNDPLKNKFDTKIDNMDFTEKKQQYIKKEAERTAKREQKKEKYTIRGEQKKTEAISKKEQKIEDHLAKREKLLKDLAKKGILTEASLDNMPKDESFGSVYDTVNTDMLTNKAVVNAYKDKTNQYKVKAEEFGPSKVQYKTIKNYREEFIKNDDKKVDDLTKSKGDTYTTNVMRKIYPTNDIKSESNTDLDSQDVGLLTSDMIKFKEFEDKGSNKFNDFINRGTYTGKEIIKNIDKFRSRTTDDSTATTKDVSKVFESKQVNKNIVDDKVNKNVLVDKVTKKDITKKIPVEQTDERIDIDITSGEKTKDINSFPFNDPILTTETPKSKKRVTVYDYLFNTPIYGEEIRVYE